MIDAVKMLEAMTQTADMGRDSLQHILGKTRNSQLSAALEKQRTQYDQTYQAAEQMLRAKGKGPRKIGGAIKLYSHAVSDIKTMTAENKTSKIAEMVIQGSTMGVTEMIKQLHNYHGSDPTLRDLAQNQIQTQEANMDEMKKFL